ncbi:MAG: PorT family protein [Bacteroidia bacterium]|jgi:hypothetical protein|nr:PorT family protein [Bacteroidia bacterium]
MKVGLFIILFLTVTGLFGQTDSTSSTEDESDAPAQFVIPPVNEQTKIGIKLGSGMCMFTGGAMQKPVPHILLSGGLYVRYRFKKHWSIQPEMNVSSRGSSFNLKESGDYRQVKLYTLDFPVLLFWGWTEQNTRNVVFGLQYSRQLSASLYLYSSAVPEPSTPALQKNDLLLIAGTHFQTPFVGVQILAKYGFIDLNNGLLPQLQPALQPGSIHQAILELNLLF